MVGITERSGHGKLLIWYRVDGRFSGLRLGDRLPDEMIHQAIEHGVCKFNVNTEIRSMYISTLAKRFATSSKVELVRLMSDSIEAMKGVVQSKINLFCSADKAQYFINNSI